MRAIITSSFVGITRTTTGAMLDEITGSPAALASAAKCTPKKLSPAQMRARISAEFSPIPAVKTRASTPLR